MSNESAQLLREFNEWRREPAHLPEDARRAQPNATAVGLAIDELLRERGELLAGVNLQLKEIERLRDRIAELEAQIQFEQTSHDTTMREREKLEQQLEAQQRAGVPEGIKVSEACIYKLNDRGYNEWFAQVQPGDKSDGTRLKQKECEHIALMLAGQAPAPKEQEQAPQPAEVGADERTGFENFMSQKGLVASYQGDGWYRESSTNLAWQAWQARAQLTAAGGREEWANQAVEAMQRARFAMEMNHWNWKSEASNDMKREAYRLIDEAIAATQPAQEQPE